jgi:protoheme ferro-lyase
MKAVLLANMGAPVSEKGMKVFLKRMFSDKAILYAPAFVRSVVSTLLSNVRYKSSWKKYLQFGYLFFDKRFGI